MKKFFASTKGKIITVVAGILVIAAAVVFILLLNSSPDGYRSISISEIYGNVMAENSGKEYKAYKNMKLADGYALTTDLDSYTRMLLDDDKYVKLEQQSHLLFESVGSSKKRLTALRLERGALVTEITKPLAEDENYVVNTPNAVLAVRGTYFRIEVMFDTNGDAYTYVYTYGGAVACRRVFPDGSFADEDVVIRAGYKACIKMDEIITVYLEETLDEISDNVDPIEYNMINDEDLVGVYNASMHGHTMFDTSEDLWNEIQDRDIDLNEYKSVYNGANIPPYNEEKSPADENNGNNSNSSANSLEHSGSTNESENSGSTSEPENSGSTSEPENSGSTGEPENSGNTSEPENSGNMSNSGGTSSTSTPGTSSSTSTLGTSSSTSTSGTSGSTSTPGTSSSTSTSGTSGSTSTPGTPGSTSTPGTSSSTSTLGTSSSTSTSGTSGSTASSSSRPGSNSGGGSGSGGGNSNSGSSHTHVFGTYFSDNNATCRADGTKTAVCVVCGAKKTIADVGTRLPHTEAEEITPPTSGSEGRRVLYCSVCGEILEEEDIPRLGLTLYIDDGSITITESGYTQGVSGFFGLDEIPYTGAYNISQRDRSKTLNNDIFIYDDVPIKLDGININGIVLTNTSGTLTGTDKENNVSQLLAVSTDRSSLTLRDITLNINSKLSADILTLESGKLYVDVTAADYGVDADNININGGLFIVEESRFYAIKYRTLNMTGGRMYARSDGVLCPWYCGLPTKPVINISGGFLWVDGEEFCDMTVAGGCVAFEAGYSIVSRSFCDTEYYCTVYDTCPGNINATLPDGTGYIYKLSPEDAAENGKYYVWLPVQPDGVSISAANFPDEKFRDYLSKNFDSDNDGVLLADEISNITEINVAGTSADKGGITSLKGIENFPKLQILRCEYNSSLISLDVSQNTELSILDCSCTLINALDVRQNTALSQLYCYGTFISSLDLINNAALTYLDCSISRIDSLNVTNNTALIYLSCHSTPLSSLDVSRNTALEQLLCNDTQISVLDLTQNIRLKHLYCTNTQITSLDLSNNAALNILYCDDCRLPFVDLSNNPSIGVVSKLHSNIYPLPASVTTMFDISTDSNFNNFDPYRASDVQNAVLDRENGIFSNITGNITYTYDCGQGFFETFMLKLPDKIDDPEKPDIEIKIEESFTDPVFMQYVKDNFDTDDDGYLSDEEIEKVTEINVSGTVSADGGITSLEGIEIFTELLTLRCEYNTGLTSLDVSGNAKLSYLTCAFTQIDELNVDNNTALTVLYCSYTPITSINVRNNTALEELHCDNTNITVLDVRSNAALTHLYCYNTLISSLDVSRNAALQTLQCQNCHIPFVDISNNNSLGSDGYAFMAGNRYTLAEDITTVFDTGGDTAFEGFDPDRVSNVIGASFSNGIFKGFTGDTITYIYECGQGYSETFTLVRSGELDGTYIAVNEENFPDPVFREYVLSRFDRDDDEAFSEEEIKAITTIYADIYGITTLKGIEYFTELINLGCGDNPYLTYLDVSNNTKLEDLSCNNTPITFLDVNHNTALTSLDCSYTQIAHLDVSHNAELIFLQCSYCHLPFIDLDLSNNSIIFTSNGVDAHGNIYPLPAGITTTFDTRTDPNFNGFDYSKVSDVEGATFEDGVFSNFTGDTITYKYYLGHYYYDDYPYDYYETFTLLRTNEPDGIEINDENFPDPVFREYVLSNFDKDDDEALSEEEIAAVTKIDVSGEGPSTYDGGITSLKGIEFFTELLVLDCHFNSQLDLLDVSNNTALIELNCNDTGITSLNISTNIALTELNCFNTQITSLDVSKNTALVTLRCYETKIESLDLRYNTALTYLWCFNTSIRILDVSQNTALAALHCSGTQISSLDVSHNTALESLYCSGTQIRSLDLSNNTGLKYLDCSNCNLPFVDVSSSPLITNLFASGNIYILPEGITTLFSSAEVTDLKGMDPDRVSDVEGAIYENGTFYNFTGDTITYTYDCGQGYSETFTLQRSKPREDIELNERNFPDEQFREYIRVYYDTDQNGWLSPAECDYVIDIKVAGTDGYYNISSLKGIEYFPRLTYLNCEYNPELEYLDISSNIQLSLLHCYNTGIRSLDLSKNPMLLILNCSDTKITELDVSQCINLQELECRNTNIKKLDLSSNTILSSLYCSGCNLPFVDVSSSKYGSNNMSVLVSKNTYPLPDGVTTVFDTRTDPNFEGFDYTRVSNVAGAAFEDGVFTNFTGDTITYRYNCGKGYTEIFTLKRP